METKATVESMEVLKLNLGFDQGLIISALGTSGSFSFSEGWSKTENL